jgi:hypothetical protein
MNLHLFLKTVFFSAKVEVIKTILSGYSAFTQSHTELFSLSEINQNFVNYNAAEPRTR